MGVKRVVTEVPPNWKESGRLLTVPEVAAISGWSRWSIYELIQKGTLIPAIGRKPYRFDPLHIYAVLCGNQTASLVRDSRAPAAPSRSLKIQAKGRSVSHKPVREEDLWQD